MIIRKCSSCNKEFVISHGTKNYLYKLTIKGKRLYQCSNKCYEKEQRLNIKRQIKH